MNKIKAFFNEEATKLKQMNFTDKRQYIWEYYKFQIFLFIIISIIVGSIINRAINPPKELYLYIAWFAPLTFNDSNDLKTGLDNIVDNPERQEVFISLYTSYGNVRMQKILAQRFQAMMQIGDIDIIIFDEYHRHDIGNFIASLDPVIEHLQYLDPTGAVVKTIIDWTSESAWAEGEIINPHAFSLANFKMFDNMDMSSDDLFLGVPAKTNNHIGIAKALMVLFYGE